MIEINKRLVRRTSASYSVLYCNGRKARRIVVTLCPGDVLEFREHGRRARWQLPIESAFRYAVRIRALAEGTRKHRTRK